MVLIPVLYVGSSPGIRWSSGWRRIRKHVVVAHSVQRRVVGRCQFTGQIRETSTNAYYVVQLLPRVQTTILHLSEIYEDRGRSSSTQWSDRGGVEALIGQLLAWRGRPVLWISKVPKCIPTGNHPAPCEGKADPVLESRTVMQRGLLASDIHLKTVWPIRCVRFAALSAANILVQKMQSPPSDWPMGQDIRRERERDGRASCSCRQCAYSLATLPHPPLGEGRRLDTRCALARRAQTGAGSRLPSSPAAPCCSVARELFLISFYAEGASTTPAYCCVAPELF
jgi:hypothetical protein